MPSGLVNIGHHGSVRGASYILRENECILFSSIGLGFTKNEIINNVKILCNIERNGSRELGIRANADPRYMTKLIISLPNENSAEINMQNLQSILKKTGIADYNNVVAIHRGIKEGIENRHAHIHFFERKFEVGNSKKNRFFNGKEFLPKFKEIYRQEFGFVLNEYQRARIGTNKFFEMRKDLLEIDQKINRLDEDLLALEVQDSSQIRNNLLEIINNHPAAKRLMDEKKERLILGETISIKVDLSLIIDISLQVAEADDNSAPKITVDTHPLYKGGRSWKEYCEDPETFFQNQQKENRRTGMRR